MCCYFCCSFQKKKNYKPFKCFSLTVDLSHSYITVSIVFKTVQLSIVFENPLALK